MKSSREEFWSKAANVSFVLFLLSMVAIFTLKVENWPFYLKIVSLCLYFGILAFFLTACFIRDNEARKRWDASHKEFQENMANFYMSLGASMKKKDEKEEHDL